MPKGQARAVKPKDGLDKDTRKFQRKLRGGRLAGGKAGKLELKYMDSSGRGKTPTKKKK